MWVGHILNFKAENYKGLCKNLIELVLEGVLNVFVAAFLQVHTMSVYSANAVNNCLCDCFVVCEVVFKKMALHMLSSV